MRGSIGFRPAEIGRRVADVMEQFDLAQVADSQPSGLPLGIRQRLQLAAACLHRPEVLILDEPTSGVDPAARNMFWRLLAELSRRDGVTIFVSTHFMNEAERCDRISLMHASRVLAVGTPQEICAAKGGRTLEEAFIAYLQEADGDISTGSGAAAGRNAMKATQPATSGRHAAAVDCAHRLHARGRLPGAKCWKSCATACASPLRSPAR